MNTTTKLLKGMQGRRRAVGEDTTWQPYWIHYLQTPGGAKNKGRGPVTGLVITKYKNGDEERNYPGCARSDLCRTLGDARIRAITLGDHFSVEVKEDLEYVMPLPKDKTGVIPISRYCKSEELDFLRNHLNKKGIKFIEQKEPKPDSDMVRLVRKGE